MNIDFLNMTATEIPNFRGGEKEYIVKMFDDGINKIMLGRLKPGATIGIHSHVESCEILFCLEGKGSVLFDGEEFELYPGNCHYCPEGHSHSVRNYGDEDLVFFATVPKQ